MESFHPRCKACGHQFSLPQSKQGAHVNCPACGELQSVGRAADVAWFWIGTIGCYGVLALICASAIVIGLSLGLPGLWITAAVVWGILTIAGMIFIASS